MYPCRAGLGDLQSRAEAAGPARVTDFPSPAFHNTQHPKIKANPRKKRNKPPSPARVLGKGDGLKFGISRAGAGRGCGCSELWGPGAHAGGAGTYKAAEHGAGDAGGQAHGRGRSGPAHMSQEPLRCPPVPGARRIPAAGPARCSRGGQEASAPAAGPRRDSRAPLPSSPQWSEPSSALQHERAREGSQARGSPETARGRRGAGRTRGPAHTQAPPSPQPLSGAGGRPQGTYRGFRESGLLGCPQTAGKERRLHLFISHLPR